MRPWPWDDDRYLGTCEMSTGSAPTAGGEAPDGERTLTSGLSTADFACVRAAGFTPLGQVRGASVRTMRPGAIADNRPWTALHTVLHTACDEAMRAMTAECRALDGDGVVAVHV